MPFAAAESVVHDRLAAVMGSGYWVCTELPPDLKNVVASTPVIQVTRFGGSDDSWVLDDANIDIDTFGLSRDAARALGERVRAVILYLFPGSTQDGAHIGRTSTISAPRWVPYDNTALRRFVGSYRITIHSVPIEGVP